MILFTIMKISIVKNISIHTWESTCWLRNPESQRFQEPMQVGSQEGVGVLAGADSKEVAQGLPHRLAHAARAPFAWKNTSKGILLKQNSIGIKQNINFSWMK